jgi:hypothetical protein
MKRGNDMNNEILKEIDDLLQCVKDGLMTEVQAYNQIVSVVVNSLNTTQQ